MACNFNIKVVEQNDFTICIPLKKRTFVASTPIDEDIDILALEDLSVKIGGAVFPATRDVAGVMVDVSRDALARGTYDVVLTATYKGHAIKAAYFDSLTIVEWNYQSDAQQCVQGSPIMFEAGFVIYNLTDAELAALKEEYRIKIAAAQQAKEEAEQAKEEYIAKAEALDDVAQQTTLVQGVSDIREDISHIDIDTSNLAKQGSNAGATLTATQTAAQNGAQFAEQAKNNAGDAKTLIGQPASGQPSTLFAAIAAGGGGGGSAAVPQISVPDSGSAATQELAANTLYIFPNRTSDLTLTLGTPVAGEASEYHFIIEVGSTLPTITLPTGLTWKSSETITFDTNTTYEVSILDNYAIFVVW
jgi:hypothetical protein